jgi:polyribonucleotide nucleotidyltransferase
MSRLAMFRWHNQLRLKAQLSTSAKNFEFMANKGFQIKNSSLSLSSGIFGHLSESSVMCRTGGSVLHASVNSARANEPNESGLPLTVDYRSRQYAFGVIPTGKNKREIHGSQDELLVARFIDRAVRPLFPKGYVNEIQLTVTSHAADGIHDPTVAAVNAASYALMKSNQPWNGPIGCVRVGLIDGVLKVDPSLQEMETSALDFLYAGTAGRALMLVL